MPLLADKIRVFTNASDPQYEWYEDCPLLIWEECPCPPDDDKIADQRLRGRLLDTENWQLKFITTHSKVPCPVVDNIVSQQRVINQSPPLRQRRLDILDKSRSNEHDGCRNLRRNVQTRDDEIDDRCYEHHRYCAVGESSSPANFSISGLFGRCLDY